MKQLINDDGINVKQILFPDEANLHSHGHLKKSPFGMLGPLHRHFGPFLLGKHYRRRLFKPC